MPGRTGRNSRSSGGASSPTRTPRTGRPTSYREEYCEIAREMCEKGATSDELARVLGVERTTIWVWATRYPNFLNSLKVGKEAADERVKASLYHRAIGYTHEAVKIFLPKDSRTPVLVPYLEHVPPDTTACIFWLKNRDRKNWRDRHPEEAPEDENKTAIIGGLPDDE